MQRHTLYLKNNKKKEKDLYHVKLPFSTWETDFHCTTDNTHLQSTVIVFVYIYKTYISVYTVVNLDEQILNEGKKAFIIQKLSA